jgi:hypothetical protein
MTAFTDEVREIVSPHKFGGSRLAAACYLLSLDSSDDEHTGEAEWSEGYVARFGRHLMTCDSQGFVYHERFASELEAVRVFEAIDQRYGEALEVAEEEREAWSEGWRDPQSIVLLDFLPGSAVRVAGSEGIAFRVDGMPTRRLADYDWSGIELVNPSQRRVHMIGDDREWVVDVDDLTPLDDDDYCGTCGQIGCSWH